MPGIIHGGLPFTYNFHTEHLLKHFRVCGIFDSGDFFIFIEIFKLQECPCQGSYNGSRHLFSAVSLANG